MQAAESFEFHGQELIVVADDQGERWVAVKPICENIGVNHHSQLARLANNPQFRCRDIATPSAGGVQQMTCIPISELNGWLYTINANRVRPEVRDNLIIYQRECSAVLFKHYMPHGGTHVELTGLIDSLSQRVDEGFASLRGEMDELRALVNITLSDTEEKEIRSLIKQIKEEKNLDGRSVVGHVRKTLGLSGVYNTPNLQQVKNVLRNMLGKGVFGAVARADYNELAAITTGLFDAAHKLIDSTKPGIF
jgi:hypothetical protein